MEISDIFFAPFSPCSSSSFHFQKLSYRATRLSPLSNYRHKDCLYSRVLSSVFEGSEPRELATPRLEIEKRKMDRRTNAISGHLAAGESATTSIVRSGKSRGPLLDPERMAGN